MAIPIVRYPDPVLLARAETIRSIDDSVRRLADAMRQTLRGEKGVGLAAPQVGVSRRLFVIEFEPENGEAVSHVLVNPRIVAKSEERETMNEGCLSVPGVSIDLARHARVELLATDLDGREVRIEACGLLARVFQHEIDHLEGKLFLDRLPTAERMRIEEELQRLATDTR